MQRRWINIIKLQSYLNDGVMTIDLQISNKVIRIVAIYLPHAHYETSNLQYTFHVLQRLIMKAHGKQFEVLIDGDLNFRVNSRVRYRVLQDLGS